MNPAATSRGNKAQCHRLTHLARENISQNGGIGEGVKAGNRNGVVSLGRRDMTDWQTNEIKRIVTDCEIIQESHGSSFSKEMAKVNAYNEIREILGIEVEDGD